jgi:hypothetical protein
VGSGWYGVVDSSFLPFHDVVIDCVICLCAFGEPITFVDYSFLAMIDYVSFLAKIDDVSFLAMIDDDYGVLFIWVDFV